MHRLFVAIRPPEPIRDLVIDAMDDSADFRWQSEEQLHITLRFVGEVDRLLANDLADALRKVRAEPFTIRVKDIGRFEQRNGGAIWAGVEPREELAALAAKVERVCQQVGLEPEHRAFHPHITRPLERPADPRGRRLPRTQARPRVRPIRGLGVHAFESRLSRHGAHYEEVATYALG